MLSKDDQRSARVYDTLPGWTLSPVDEFQPMLGLEMLPGSFGMGAFALREHLISILEARSEECGPSPAVAGCVLALLRRIPTNLVLPRRSVSIGLAIRQMAGPDRALWRTFIRACRTMSCQRKSEPRYRLRMRLRHAFCMRAAACSRAVSSSCSSSVGLCRASSRACMSSRVMVLKGAQKHNPLRTYTMTSWLCAGTAVEEFGYKPGGTGYEV